MRHLAGLEPPPIAHRSASDITKEMMLKAIGVADEPKQEPAAAEKSKDEAKK